MTWRSRLWLLYWVSTQIRRMPALTRLDSAKSTSRYRPPNGTAGLARSSVSGASRLPAPPASTMPRTCGSAVSSSSLGQSARMPLRQPVWWVKPEKGTPQVKPGGSSGSWTARARSAPSRPCTAPRARAAGQVDQSLGAVVEVLAQDLMLGALGGSKVKSKNPAGNHDPADVGEALLDDLDRRVGEHAVRVHEVEVVVRQELQPQVADQAQVRQLGCRPYWPTVSCAASRMSGEMSMP